MEGLVGLPAQGDWEICWYDLHWMVDKPMCYHANNLGLIPCGGHTNISPYLLVLLGQLSLPSLQGW